MKILYNDGTTGDCPKELEQDVLRHSAAHIMAQAVKRLYPEAHFAYGPATEKGFYYDIDLGDISLSEEDLPAIEQEMRKIVKENLPFKVYPLPREEAVKLIIKGKLKAQKPMQSVITGHQITLHDNVFNPELVKVLQGGTILYWQDANHTTTGETETNYGVAKYTPPVVGSDDKGVVFTLNSYSAIYNAAGIITGYEKTMYPNCTGVPVAFNTEDGSFRTPEYTINSAPNTGEAPYDIDYIAALPELTGTTNMEGPA